jgi:hypothetical protein
MGTIYRTPDEAPPLDARISEHELNEFQALEKEREKRKLESLKLYEPLPFQEEYHRCTAKECILQKGNQAGGSLTGFVEVARAITGQDPYNKYPKENGVAVCLGYGEKHVGRVIHKYLFRAGAFQIIRDEETGEWRTFHPWPRDQVFCGKAGDIHRAEEAKPAPPLIPHRFIDGNIAWHKRSEFIFSYVQFINGWELYALNSAGEASQAQGFQVDLYDIDEDVATSGWHEEAVGRTAIREGKIRWHALPHSKTDDIINMIHRAIDEEDKGIELESRTTVRITATMYDNPFYPEKSRRANEIIWKSQGEDVFRKRALGEITTDTVLMYPTFNKDIHNAIKYEGDRNKVQETLTKEMGVPPLDWCRYMVVDPGHTVCAVTFWATPPPSFGEYRVCYDELYIRNCDAVTFGRHVSSKTANFCFQDFIIDAHGGNLRELGSGVLPRRQYESQLEAFNIKCVEREHRFRAGSDDIKGREIKLREWLGVRPSGDTMLLIVMSRCPNLVREIERFRKKTVKLGGQDVATDEGNRRANTHAVETAEYAAAHGLPYFKPAAPRVNKSPVRMILEARKERAMQRNMIHGKTKLVHYLGPRGSLTT